MAIRGRPNSGDNSPQLGRWWLPERPDDFVAGNLVTDGDGPITVELAGSLGSGSLDDRFDVVLGVLNGGRYLTLEGVAPIRSVPLPWDRRPGRHPHETLMASTVYQGDHLPAPADRQFLSAIIELTHLPEWVGTRGFVESHSPRPGISFETPPERVVKRAFATVALAFGWSVTGDLTTSRTIARQTAFHVRADRPMSMGAWYWSVVRPLRHFVTFAAGRAAAIDLLRMTSATSDDPQRSVEVLVPGIDPSRRDRPDRSDFLFRLKDVEDDFESVLSRWLDLVDRAGPALDVLFGPVYRPDTFLDNHFLNAVQAAEGYHRLLFDGRRRSLASRLTELYESVKPLVVDAIVSVEGLVKPVVKARNTSTHVDAADPEAASRGRHLLRLVQMLTLVMTADMLRRIGFDDAQCEKALARSRSYRMLTEVG